MPHRARLILQLLLCDFCVRVLHLLLVFYSPSRCRRKTKKNRVKTIEKFLKTFKKKIFYEKKMCAVQLNGCEIRKGRKVGVTISHNNHRLFVGNIPKNRDRLQLYEDFAKYARKSTKTKKVTRRRRWLPNLPLKFCCLLTQSSRLQFNLFFSVFLN